MSKYVICLPLLAACGFAVAPAGVHEKSFDADEIAALSDGGRGTYTHDGSAGAGDHYATLRPDAAELPVDEPHDADAPAWGEDAGQREQDVAVDAGMTDSGVVDSGTEDASADATVPDAAAPPSDDGAVCTECTSDADCAAGLVCATASLSYPACLPQIAITGTQFCMDICEGRLPREVLVTRGELVKRLCAPLAGGSCLDFLAAGGSCD